MFARTWRIPGKSPNAPPDEVITAADSEATAKLQAESLQTKKVAGVFIADETSPSVVRKTEQEICSREVPLAEEVTHFSTF
jgi:hypothetical protein